MKSTFTVILLSLICIVSQAQVNARLMRYPDVSSTHITFVYGDDIWIVPKTGGTASRLSTTPGAESFPRFSPEGNQIAFTANYEGNSDIYVINSKGGIPKRLTYHGMFDRTLDWYPDGSEILFASSRESGRQRYNQFYKISPTGGHATKLPVPYGEYASLSPDGAQIAYTDRTRVHRTWKRYRGGTAPDIHIFNLSTREVRTIASNDANDELPMWHNNTIYFLSDRGPADRANIWKYDLGSGTTTQLTKFTDFDIHYPSLGPEDIVFQAGDKLYLLNLGNDQYNEVTVNAITDERALIPSIKKVASMIQSATVSPDGKRVVVQARGELFTLPSEEGYVADLTNTSGAAERSPAWSPDGKTVAYWSDAEGEYQLMLLDMTKDQPARKLSSFTSGFRYNIFWSPDSKKIAFIDQAMKIQIMNIATGQLTQVDHGKYMFEGGLRNFTASWSSDSRFLAYAREITRVSNAIFIFDNQSNISHQVTSGYYNDGNPVFSADSKYLFYSTNRTFRPNYSDLDNTFIYPNTTNIAVVSLAKDTESLLKVKNDAVDIKKDEKKEDEGTGKKSKKGKKKSEDKSEEEGTKPVKVDFQNFESRTELLPVDPGNIGRLSAVEGKLLYVRFPNTGAEKSAKARLDYYDFDKRESKTIINGVANYEVSANGKKALVSKDGKLAVISISEGASMDKKVPTEDMAMSVVPREEWMQIFNDAWRMERDYFYDPNMHGVNWQEMKSRYGALVNQANARGDLNFIIGELIGELSSSHTYRGGGDLERAKRLNVGYLGADYRVENNKYRIAKILSGAAWDAEVHSPLAKPGINVTVGDYVLAVNGQPVDATKPIHAWFQGLAGKTVELTVNSTPALTGSHKVMVIPLRSETRLRHLAWIESNRKRVDEATGGKIGYVYVRSTGLDGQNELIRQYYAQIDKEGMIIDERFNSGGQIPDRFIELLNRKPLAFWAVRDGEDWSWPPVANFGPKVMLINGFSGSGGDAFPDFFRKAELGPLIGTRTWGGLIGISGAPSLIDNGRVTVPTFRMYNPDGKWFLEGHGVDPDIPVTEDFQQLANGKDVQLEAAISEVMKELDSSSAFKKPARPAYQNRNK